MRKLFTLCMVLMLCVPALAEPLIARYSTGDVNAGYCILLDESGALLTPRDTYGNIYTITEEEDADSPRLFAVSEAVLRDAPADEEDFYTNPIALMDETGKLLTGFDYTYFYHHPRANTVIFSGPSGLQGAMDESGRILLPDRFISLVPNDRGGFLAIACPDGGSYNYDTAYPLLYIDEKGRSFDTEYMAMPYGLGAFSEGFCTVTLTYEPGVAGNIYLDFEGTNIFRSAYGWTEPFYGNYAIVRDNESSLCGIIDKTGKWALPPEYISIDSGAYYDAGVYLACTDTHAVLLDAWTLEERCRIDCVEKGITYAFLSGKDFITGSGEHTTFLFDTDGSLIAESNVNIDHYYSLYADKPQRVVRTEGEWPGYVCTLMDLSGNTRSTDFQSLMPVSWLDGQGRYIYATFDIEPGPDGQSYPDWASYRYGLCDQDGSILLEAKYSSLDALSPTRYWARLGSRTGMIDETGKWYYKIDDYEYLMD